MALHPCVNMADGCRNLAVVGKPRCPGCEAEYQRERNARRPYYAGPHAARAKRVRDEANADPATTCWRCGRLAVGGDPWQAGHVVDGDPNSLLLAEHRSCNARAGQALGQARGSRER